MAITYHTNDCSFALPHKGRITTWIKQVIETAGARVGEVNVVFCSDKALLEINQTYLQHDYFTDIITFDYCQPADGRKKGVVAGDLMISVDTVRSNAQEFIQPFEKEVHRVIIHGILHLLGQGDKTPGQAKTMRAREEACLSLLEAETKEKGREK